MSAFTEEKKNILYGVAASAFGFLALAYGVNEGDQSERSMRELLWVVIMFWGVGRLLVSYYNIKDMKNRDRKPQ